MRLGHVGQFGVARRNRSGGGRLMLVGILEYSPVNACVVSNRMPVEKTRRECMASPWMDGVLPISMSYNPWFCNRLALLSVIKYPVNE
jgi:hypothetical protein